MKRIAAFFALALLVVAATFVWTIGRTASTGRGPVYGVAQLSSALAHHRTAWQGRTVLVRGQAVAYADGNGVVLLECGSALTACAFQAPERRPIHLLLVADGAYRGGVMGVSVGNGLMTYTAANGATGYPSLLLSVQPAPTSPLLSALRRLPVLGPLAPPASRQFSGAAHVYRVRISPAGAAACGGMGPLCDNATLLDG